ncbi:MAG: hypothetical protein LBT27_06805, partial [Prevotellaceae bacterium]|nr:hypothetical protein [Prevotellaceae bacterium]
DKQKYADIYSKYAKLYSPEIATKFAKEDFRPFTSPGDHDFSHGDIQTRRYYTTGFAASKTGFAQSKLQYFQTKFEIGDASEIRISITDDISTFILPSLFLTCNWIKEKYDSGIVFYIAAIYSPDIKYYFQAQMKNNAQYYFANIIVKHINGVGDFLYISSGNIEFFYCNFITPNED